MNQITQTQAELIEHYAAVRARMAAAGKAFAHRAISGPKPWSIAPAPLPVLPMRVRAARDYISLEASPSDGPVNDLLLSAFEHVPEWKQILREVSERHRIPANMIMGIQRERRVVAARQEYMYRLYYECAMSLPAIGRRAGGKDHTTVLYSIRRHEKRLTEARGRAA